MKIGGSYIKVICMVLIGISIWKSREEEKFWEIGFLGIFTPILLGKNIVKKEFKVLIDLLILFFLGKTISEGSYTELISLFFLSFLLNYITFKSFLRFFISNSCSSLILSFFLDLPFQRFLLVVGLYTACFFVF